MSDFLKRLTGVFHWICFLISVLIAFFILSQSANNPNPLWLTLLMILTPNVIGWLIKYIFTGNSKFLPF